MLFRSDDETACRAKIAYADRKGLGGFIIWELGDGYRPTQPAGQRDVLLQTVKQSLADLYRISALTITNSNAVINFSSVTGLQYALETTDALATTNPWTPLTNLTATAPRAQFTNSLTSVVSNRFYRVRRLN